MTFTDYRKALDRLIMEILYTERPYGYRELKRRIEEPLNHQISFDTYDRHIDRLVKRQFLNKKKDGQKVFYSITQKSKNILDKGQEIDATM